MPILIINFIFKQSSQFIQDALYAIRAFEHSTEQIGGKRCSQSFKHNVIYFIVQKNNNLHCSQCIKDCSMCYPDVQVKYFILYLELLFPAVFAFRLVIITFIRLLQIKFIELKALEYIYIHLNADLCVYLRFARDRFLLSFAYLDSIVLLPRLRRQRQYT